MIDIDIEYVKTVARDAGIAAVARLDGIEKIQTEFKADDSYVTDIDRDTEQFIRGRLAQRYPDFSFQGEEFGRFGADGAPLWAVDPIDGTTNMVFGIPHWGVSIGLIAGGHAVAGAFYLPRTDEMFWGVRGGGSFCNGKRLHAEDRDTLHPEDTIGFTSSSIRRFNLESIVGRIRSLGSIATEVAYTARGSLCSHVGCHEGINDLAAGLCISHEAGCIFAYLTGEPLDIGAMVRDGRTHSPFLIAPPRLAASLRAQLRPR